jgi:hypothetical protein
MRIVIEDVQDHPQVERQAPAVGETVDAGPAPIGLIRRFAPELAAEHERAFVQREPDEPGDDAPASLNPLRAGAEVARRYVRGEPGEEAGELRPGGEAPGMQEESEADEPTQ